MASSHRELSVLPPMYGRESAGHSDDQQHVPAGRHDQRAGGGQQVPDPGPQPGAAGDQVRQRERRQHEQALEHLGQEGEAEGHSGQQQPAQGRPPALGLDRPDHEVAGQGHQEDQQCVRVVEPEHQRRDRGQGDQTTGDEPGARHRTSGAPRPRSARPCRPPAGPGASASTRS